MSKHINLWVVAMIAVLISRFFGMALFPFADTTEPRYAEIARLMAESGDWITPWFEPGVPFWGKPPLSFWAQAGAIKLFGLSEFALRLPSWIASVGILALTWRFAKEVFGSSVAYCSGLVLSSMALFYISAGAVMTDAFLVLGTTLSLVSFGMVCISRIRVWRWLFFVGIVIGLLAKGPLAVILIGMPIAVWLLCHRERMTWLRRFPWAVGTLLTIALALPWYIAAELKTPGFLNYFIIGEHFSRFIDPGWAGDLYGTAHERPKGMIWVFWLWASFPWGLLAVLGLCYALFQGRSRLLLRSVAENPGLQFMLFCATAPLFFFTLAGNTLWTYVLPALPFSAIVIAKWLMALPVQQVIGRRAMVATAGLAPLVATVFVMVAVIDQNRLKTEADLIGFYENHLKTEESILAYLNGLPFSARYYSRGQAETVSLTDLVSPQARQLKQPVFIAIPRQRTKEVLAALPAATLTSASNRRYQLISLLPPSRPDNG